MSNFKNMKIEVNAEQPLDEIVRELVKNGYLCNFSTTGLARLIIVFDSGYFGIYSSTRKTDSCDFKTTTLAELKEM